MDPKRIWLALLAGVTTIAPAVADTATEDLTVEFSGHTWRVKDAPVWGPGPNRWSAENVSVDEAGLHLSIAEVEGELACAEVELAEALGYGEYRWQVRADVPAFSPKHVFACFLYEADDREIDVMEISRWGRDDERPVFQHVVQPGDSKSKHRFFSDAREFTVALDWAPGRVKCRMWEGPTGDLVSYWSYSGEKVPIPSDKLTPRMNLWLFRGEPGEQPEMEATIRSFTFTPAPDAPDDEQRIYVALQPDGPSITGRIAGVPDGEVGRYRVRVVPLVEGGLIPLRREADAAGNPGDAVFSIPLRVRVELIDTLTGEVVQQSTYPE